MLRSPSKSLELEESLLGLIRKDGLKPGDPILSENRLCALFGVSRSTVRQALGRLEERGVLRSERGRGSFVAQPPALDERREREASKLLGFACFGGIANAYTSSIARGLESGAEEEGYSLCVGSVMGGVEREAAVVRKLLRRGVDALAIAPTESNPPSRFLEELARGDAKLVIVDECIPGVIAPTVLCDDREGGFLAANLLIAAGHKRIAHLRGPALKNNAADRFEGYRKALERAGLPYVEKLAPQPADKHSGYSEEAGREGMLKLLELPRGQRPSAVFAANDHMAIGAWEALKEKGLRVPEDISLIGYGNLHAPYGKGLLLTSVDQHPLEIGLAAWGLLRKMLEQGKGAAAEKTLLRPQIVERGSVAAPKGIQ